MQTHLVQLLKLMIRSALIILIIGLIQSNWLIPIVQAQDTGTQLSVSPPTAFIKVKPGGRATHTITIENTSDQIMALRPVFYDFKSDGKTGLPNLSPNFTFPYLDIPAGGFPKVQIPARSKAQLTLLFDPPQSAVEGEYPITVVFESAFDPEPGQTSVIQGIGSNVVVLVTNQDRHQLPLQIDQLKTTRLVDSFSPLNLEISLKNDDPASQVASGSARLKNWRGQTLQEWILYPDVVLGHSSRLARSLLINPAPTGEDNPYSATDFSFSHGFNFGLYTWQVQLTADSKSDLTQSIQVLALPWVVMLLLTVGLGLVGFWLILDHKNKSI